MVDTRRNGYNGKHLNRNFMSLIMEYQNMSYGQCTARLRELESYTMDVERDKSALERDLASQQNAFHALM